MAKARKKTKAKKKTSKNGGALSSKKKTQKKRNAQIIKEEVEHQVKMILDAKKFETFERLCYIRCSKDEIASVLRVTPERLVKDVRAHYMANAEEFGIHVEKGQKLLFKDIWNFFSTGAKVSIRRKQFTRAMEGSDTMLKHLGEHWLGQKPTKNLNHSGSIHEQLIKDLSDFEDDEDLILEIDEE